jgi:RNase P/RNase MRP subunit POP5
VCVCVSSDKNWGERIVGQVTKKLLGNINHAERESSFEGMDASSDIARQEQRRTIIDCRRENCHYSF